METATLAGGCFWCTEGIFKQIRGVDKVFSGYSGGTVGNPTSEQVYSETTGHAESIQIKFDPKKVTFKDLLYIFFRTHDPTTKNRQGYDAGTEYRSVIFYHNEKQRKEAETAKADAQKLYPNPIVTEIVPFKKFYKADEHHQDYYKKNPKKPYCTLVIDPKINKLKKDFKKYIK